MSSDADTLPPSEITLGDVYDALGSVVLRLDALTHAVQTLANEVHTLSEHDRHFVTRVREAVGANGSQRS